MGRGDGHRVVRVSSSMGLDSLHFKKFFLLPAALFKNAL